MIRPAVPADVPLIAALISELADYERLGHEVFTDPAMLAEHLFGERRYAEVLLAEVSGEAVGFALFFHNYSTFLSQPGLYLEDLYIRPAHRGQGLGKALLSALARVALERRCGRFEWSVLDWNDPAIGFYRKLGAVPLSDWTVYRLAGPAMKLLAEAGG